MTTIKGLINKELRIGNLDYYLIRDVDSPLNEHVVPKYQLFGFVEVGSIYTFQKLRMKTSNKVYLKLLKTKEEFEILRKKTIKNNFNEEDVLFVLKYQNIELEVQGFKWQKNKNWDYKTLFCEIDIFNSDGKPVLINKDFRHPDYEICKIYEFKVLNRKKKITGTLDCDVYELLGIDNCTHDVKMLQGQVINNIIPDFVKCKILDIKYRLYLAQVEIKDPYFQNIENLLNNRQLISKYFKPLFNENDGNNEDVNFLIEQYNSEHAFWVFTFVKILINKFKFEISRLNYGDAKEVNKIIIILEKWILSKGIITAITSEVDREATSLKAKDVLDLAIIKDQALDILIEHEYNFLDYDYKFSKDKNSVLILANVLYYSNIDLVNDNDLVMIFKRLLKEAECNGIISRDDINKILYVLSYKKKQYLSKNEAGYFNLIPSSDSPKYSNTKLEKYLLWTYCELLFAIKLNRHESANILIGQSLRILTQLSNSARERKLLIHNAYKYLDNYQDSHYINPLYFDNKIKVNLSILSSIDENSNECNKEWELLEMNYEKDCAFEVKLTSKSESGYQVEYHSLKGFLPMHHITEKILRLYPYEECDFVTTVKCLSVSKIFNYFIVKQIDAKESICLLKSNSYEKLTKGSVFNGIIKSVENYGLFVSTKTGGGLLKREEIFDFYWDYKNIHEYFVKGQEIRVYVKEVDDPYKASFSHKVLKNIDPEYYNYIQKNSVLRKPALDFQHENDNTTIETKADVVQREKAYCFEQYAILQNDISEKLNAFRIAKQFFAITSHARSYLINIYTSYFEIILKIKSCIESRDLSNLESIKNDALKIKDKIYNKTIEAFPDSEKLKFFIEVIMMFNETQEQFIDKLFDNIKIYSQNAGHKELTTISKITLANNLMLSESKEDANFSLRNLRLIYDYISTGILSLEENPEDKMKRELSQELIYWKERIRDSENEKLELKETLFTPVYRKKSGKVSRVNLELNVEQSESQPDVELKKKILHSSMKTLCAFANTSGGDLLLGVNDDGVVVGLEKEFETFKNKDDKNRDGFGKYFDEKVREYLGDSFSSLINRKFIKFPEGDILCVRVSKSIQEVFLRKDEKGRENEQLYIRNLASSKELKGSELVKYVKNRYSESNNNNKLSKQAK